MPMYTTKDGKQRFKLECPVDRATYLAVQRHIDEWGCNESDFARSAIHDKLRALEPPTRGVVDRAS